MAGRDVVVDGPLFDDLAIGDRFAGAPPVTLTDGMAAAHHAIVGGRLRLAFDHGLSARVTREAAPFASPGLAWDVAIGQSTEITQRGIANLFYRGLVFARAPAIGDTLRTETQVIGLRPVSPKPGRPPRGLVVMRVATRDQKDRPVLDFFRCAMLPARAENGLERGKMEPAPAQFSAEALVRPAKNWVLGAFRADVTGPHFVDLVEGSTYSIAGGDLVSSAPELARLTMNIAAMHHDHTGIADGQRLVYGGHTIGLAAAQVTRALPSLMTILAWEGCDHTGPVHEGDTLHSEIAIERCEPLPGGGGLVHLRVLVRATKLPGGRGDVLDWRLVGLFA